MMFTTEADKAVAPLKLVSQLMVIMIFAIPSEFYRAEQAHGFVLSYE